MGGIHKPKKTWESVEVLFQDLVEAFFFFFLLKRDFLGGSDSKESACNVRYPGSIPGSGRSPGGGNGNPL